MGGLFWILGFQVTIQKLDRCRNTLRVDKCHDVGFARKDQILARNTTLLKLLVHLGRIRDRDKLVGIPVIQQDRRIVRTDMLNRRCLGIDVLHRSAGSAKESC